MTAGTAPGPGPVAAIEVGGTHVTAALVGVRARQVIDGTRRSRALDPHGSAGEILDAMVACVVEAVESGPAVDDRIAVAMPGPFEYDTGIARFAGVGKFESLAGVDVGAALRDGLAPRTVRTWFVNDADAFAIGEWTSGAARGHDRALVITIGSGIGSAFLDHGRVVESGDDVPPIGRVYRLPIDGVELEDRVSRRAILRAADGHPALARPGADVRELAEVAGQGDLAAALILADAFNALGRAIGPWLTRFRASILVVGGSIARSWDLLEPPLTDGLRQSDRPWAGPVRPCELGDDAGLIGAAIASRRVAG